MADWYQCTVHPANEARQRTVTRPWQIGNHVQSYGTQHINDLGARPVSSIRLAIYMLMADSYPLMVSPTKS